MKNTHIPNLKSVVPADIRLQVAIETAEFIRSGVLRYFHLDSRDGLCLLFPCIMWGMEEYSFPAPDDEDWDWEDTSTAFPELENWLETSEEERIPETRLEWIENYMIPKLKKELAININDI